MHPFTQHSKLTDRHPVSRLSEPKPVLKFVGNLANSLDGLTLTLTNLAKILRKR
jgi:hypothetical protein